MDPITFIFGIGLLIASYTITTLMAPTPTKPERASLADFDFPQTKEGTPQCVIFGDVWIEDWTVLYYGNLRTSAIKSGGGKK